MNSREEFDRQMREADALEKAGLEAAAKAKRAAAEHEWYGPQPFFYMDDE